MEVKENAVTFKAISITGETGLKVNPSSVKISSDKEGAVSVRGYKAIGFVDVLEDER